MPADVQNGTVCPSCGRDRGNREPHRPECIERDTPKRQGAIGEALETVIRADMERAMVGIVDGIQTSTTATPAPPLTEAELRDKFREWGNLIRESRRASVTIVVVDGHTGPPVHSQHPTEGRFIECTFAQAAHIHRETPLRLVKVLAPDRAHFEVATPLHGLFCPLIPPPYEMPPEGADA